MALAITEREPTLRTFTIDFSGTRITTTVTANASVVTRWIHTVLGVYRRHLHHLVVGLGVQWSPYIVNAPAATLQLCVGRRCLIFQLCRCNAVPSLLRHFLKNPNNTFVGIWNHSDDLKLYISEHEVEMLKRPLDLRLHAMTGAGESLAGESFERIVEECLGVGGVKLERDTSASDWEKEVLDDEQVLQATVDAYASFLIGRNLRAWEIVTEYD